MSRRPGQKGVLRPSPQLAPAERRFSKKTGTKFRADVLGWFVMRGVLRVIGGSCLLAATARAQTTPPAPYRQTPPPSYPQQAYPQQPYPQQPYAQQPAQAPAAEGPPPVYQPSYGPYHRPPVTDQGDEGKDRPAWELTAPPSRHRHDGLYLRFGGGIGSGFDSLEGSGTIGDGSVTASSATGSAGGFAGATEIAFGASPIAGLALGGGVYTGTIAAPESDDMQTGGASGATPLRYTFTVTQLAMFAAFADVYPWPSGGLHAQAGVGFATLVAGLGTPASAAATGTLSSPQLESHTGTGFGFMVGAGYDWWVADEWSVGALARLLYAWTSGNDRDGVAWSHQTGALALLLTVTYQ